jgi:biopolymer transport protein ExbD
MPVKLGSQLPADTEARIEIIPLIDIMFFLLAAFMLVSLSMVNLRRVEVNLPSAATASQEIRRNLVSIAVDKAGLAYIDRRPTGLHELAAGLAAIQRTNAALRVVISGDTDARHGDIIRVLDAVRLAGVQNVAFELRAVPKAATSKAP